MKIEEIRNEMLNELEKVSNLKELDELRVKYLGKKGIITELNSEIKNVPNEEKKALVKMLILYVRLFKNAFLKLKKI